MSGRICSALLIMIATCCPLASHAADARGKATFVIPDTYGDAGSPVTYQRTWVVLTNTSSASVSVTIRFLQQDGSVLTDTDNSSAAGVVRALNVSNYSDTTAGVTATFDIAAGQSAECGFFPGSTKFGWGMVEWVQGSSGAAVALLGIVWRELKGPSAGIAAESVVTLNGGQPF